MVDINSSDLQSQGPVINIAAGASVQVIQNAINNAEPGSIIQLAAGTYEFTHQLLISRSDIELRGMGSGETIIQAKFADGQIDNLIQVEGSAGLVFTLQNDAPQGSNVITLNNTSRIEVGDVLQVRQANDADYLATLGDGSWSSAGWLRDSLARVAQISGNQVIFEHDLEFDFEGGVAEVKKLNMAENVKLSQFTVSYEDALGVADYTNMTNTAPEYAVWGHNTAVRLFRTANAELFDITVENSGSTAFEFITSLEIQGSELVANGAHNKAAGNGGSFKYGSIHHSVFTDIEDYGMRHGVTAFGHQSSTNNLFKVRFTDTNIDWHGGQDHDNTVIVEKSILMRGRDWDPWAVRTNVNGSYAGGPTDPDANITVFEYLQATKHHDEAHAVDYGGELIGAGNNDTLHGGLGDDTLQGGGQVTLYKTDNDIIDGGAGFDRAVFVGNRSDYKIEISGGIVIVTDSVEQRDGTDRLENIELLQFADQTLTVPDLKIYVPPTVEQQDDEVVSDSGNEPTPPDTTTTEDTTPADDGGGDEPTPPDTTTTEDTTPPADDGSGDATDPQTDGEASSTPDSSAIMIRFGGETAGNFNGVDQFAEVAHSDDYLLDNGTISLSFRADDAVRAQGLVSKDSFGYDTGGHFSIFIDDGRLVFRMQSTDKSYYLRSAPDTILADTWHVATVNWGEQGMVLHLDGEEVASKSYAGGLGSTSGGQGNFAPLVVGAWTGTADDFTSEGVQRFFGGDIADVLIFDQALAPWEVESFKVAEAADEAPTTTEDPDTDPSTQTDDPQPSDTTGETTDTEEPTETTTNTTVAAGPVPIVVQFDGESAGQFDGIDDFAEVPHSDDLLLDQGTISLAFKADDLDGTQGLVSKDSFGYDTGGHFGLRLVGDQLQFRIQSIDETYKLTSPAGTVTADSWHTVSVTWGSEGLALYLDGALQAENDYTGGLGATSGGDGNFAPLVIGAWTGLAEDFTSVGANQFFGGEIADVLVYSQVLTPSEIEVAQGDAPASGYTLTDGMLVVTDAEKTGHITVSNFDNLSGESDTEAAGIHDVINLKGLFDQLGGIYVDGSDDLNDRTNAIVLQQADLDNDGNDDDVALTVDGVAGFSITFIDPSNPWPEVFGVGNGDGEFDDIWV